MGKFRIAGVLVLACVALLLQESACFSLSSRSAKLQLLRGLPSPIRGTANHRVEISMLKTWHKTGDTGVEVFYDDHATKMQLQVAKFKKAAKTLFLGVAVPFALQIVVVIALTTMFPQVAEARGRGKRRPKGLSAAAMSVSEVASEVMADGTTAEVAAAAVVEAVVSETKKNRGFTFKKGLSLMKRVMHGANAEVRFFK